MLFISHATPENKKIALCGWRLKGIRFGAILLNCLGENPSGKRSKQPFVAGLVSSFFSSPKNRTRSKDHATEGCGEKMQRALQHLREAGVLEYSAQRKNNVITPPREATLAMLREHGTKGLSI